MTRNIRLIAALASVSVFAVPAVAQVATETAPQAQSPTMEPAEDAVTGTAPATGTTATPDVSADTQADAAAEAANDQTADTATTADTAASSATATQMATAADVKAGVAVVDPQGAEVGKIESVSATGAVISTGKARVQIPIASFAKNDLGLVISMTKAQLEAEASKPSA